MRGGYGRRNIALLSNILNLHSYELNLLSITMKANFKEKDVQLEYLGFLFCFDFPLLHNLCAVKIMKNSSSWPL